MSKALRLEQITVENQDCLFFFYRVSNHENFFRKYLDNAPTDFA